MGPRSPNLECTSYVKADLSQLSRSGSRTLLLFEFVAFIRELNSSTTTIQTLKEVGFRLMFEASYKGHIQKGVWYMESIQQIFAK